jgi:hypothetical protein
LSYEEEVLEGVSSIKNLPLPIKVISWTILGVVIVLLALPFIFLVLPFVLLVRWVKTMRNKGAEEDDWLKDLLPKWLSEVLRGDLLLGMYLGVGAGVWAISVTAVEGSESSDLIGLAGAAVGLLAVTLAVMGLLMGFLSDRTEKMIMMYGGVKGFFRPFKFTAWVSAIAILVCVAGAIDATRVFTDDKTGAVITHPGPTWLAAVLYGASVWLFVWAVIGVAQLVGVFLKWGRVRELMPDKDVKVSVDMPESEPIKVTLEIKKAP